MSDRSVFPGSQRGNVNIYRVMRKEKLIKRLRRRGKRSRERKKENLRKMSAT